MVSTFTSSQTTSCCACLRRQMTPAPFWGVFCRFLTTQTLPAIITAMTATAATDGRTTAVTTLSPSSEAAALSAPGRYHNRRVSRLYGISVLTCHIIARCQLRILLADTEKDYERQLSRRTPVLVPHVGIQYYRLTILTGLGF